MGTCKLVMGSFSVPLDNILQPVRPTLQHVAQSLAGYCAPLYTCAKRKVFVISSFIFTPLPSPTITRGLADIQRGGMHRGTGIKFFCILLVKNCLIHKTFILQNESVLTDIYSFVN